MIFPRLAAAEASGPDFYRVIDVAADDVLNMRAGPSATHQKIGALPPQADGAANLGCIGGLTFAEWEKATAEERLASRRNRWCLLGYERNIGWVAGRYLAEGSAPDAFKGGAPLAGMEGSEWKAVRLGGSPVESEIFVRFGAEGKLAGNGGCNQFQGTYNQDRNSISIGPLATTRKLCTPEIMNTEQAFISLLENTRTLVARHLILALLAENSEILAQFQRTDFD